MAATYTRASLPRRVALLAGVLALLWMASPAWGQQLAVHAGRTFDFDTPGLSFRSDFPGARINDCIQVSQTEYRVRILPENTPINNSAWYAFQVTSQVPRTITVRLNYEGGSHRYHPKISHDGVRWTPLGPEAYTRDGKRQATLHLEAGPEPLWVAAQELVTSKRLSAWADELDRLEFVHKSVLGRSVLGRPIHKLDITGAKDPGYVFIIGRQHPPEVTGSLALMRFVETVVADSDLARRFRARFNVIVVPLVNPDGVEAGHWRHNINGVDLNRDWVKCTQPETRALRDEILKFKSAAGPRLYLFLDFHSTHRDVFYTQPDRLETFPKDFTRKWLDAVQGQFPDYEVRRVGSHGPTLKTSKRWVYHELGVPSITYEFGDHTARPLLNRISEGAAEEMMRLLLIEVGSVKNRAAFRDYLPSRCFSNQASKASLARLPSSPRKPWPAPSITSTSQVTFFFSNSVSIFSLWSNGTSLSWSPWTSSVGGSSSVTCRMGE